MSSDSKSNSVKKKNAHIEKVKSFFNKYDKRTTISFSVLAVMLFLGASATAYTNFVINDPDNVWNKALENTELYTKKIETSVEDNKSVGGSFKGQIDIVKPTVFSGTLEGSWYEKDVAAQSQLNISNFKIGSELLSVFDSESNTNSVFVKFDGLNSTTLLLGLLQPEIMPYINEINNSWYKIDKPINAPPIPSQSSNLFTPDNNMKSINSLLSNIGNNQYLERKFVGEEQVSNKDTFKYVIKADKDELSNVFTEIINSLNQYDNNILEDGEFLESVGKIKEQLDSFESETYEIEVWVDKNYKYFTKIKVELKQFNTGNEGYLEFGLNYTGGDEYPFYTNIEINELTKKERLNLLSELRYYTTNGNVDLSMKVDTNGSNQDFSVSAILTLSPSDEVLDIKAPESSRDIEELIEIIDNLNLDGLSSSSADIFPSQFIFDDVELR